MAELLVYEIRGGPPFPALPMPGQRVYSALCPRASGTACEAPWHFRCRSAWGSQWPAV